MQRELRQLQLRLGQLESNLPAAATAGPDGDNSSAGKGSGGDADQHVHQQQQQPGGPLDLQQVAFPLRPIGIMTSCFSRRNGTPRQPLLVPAARARLSLRPDLSADFLEGLQGYSHCWVLYVFHENTDLQRLWQAEAGSGVRAKIRVPRLDGAKLGVFATRSPHRWALRIVGQERGREGSAGQAGWLAGSQTGTCTHLPVRLCALPAQPALPVLPDLPSGRQAASNTVSNQQVAQLPVPCCPAAAGPIPLGCQCG